MERILKDKAFLKMLKQLAEEHKIPAQEVATKAKKYLKEIYTEHKSFTEIIAVQAIQYLLSRGYDKTIDVDPSDIKTLTKIAHRNPIAFVMTHKSYIDMLVLSLVLMRYGLPMAYTFAGLNMAFLGTGQLGRNAGVIFIRRSFKDNILYKSILRFFIADLVRHKSSFMWAIEGTRSRTGKLVWPKMGILKYIHEAEIDTGMEVKYVPVSIVYDLIPDVKDMTEEGRGKAKKPESLSWFINYFRDLSGNMGRISLRLGEPVNTQDIHFLKEEMLVPQKDGDSTISLFAMRLVHRINQITPVTTSSLVCIALLSKYALSKVAVERDVAAIMDLIERKKPDALVDRGSGIGESVQIGINLMEQAGIVHKYGEGLLAKYAIRSECFLEATYYANMAAHHLYHSAFIELALVSMIDTPVEDRQFQFWKEIMKIRDLFKFEFFYSPKAEFSDEIENDLSAIIQPDSLFWDSEVNVRKLLDRQAIFISPVVLHTYIDAYQVVAHGLMSWDPYQPFEEGQFIKYCLFHGGEMQWQGKIQHIESVSKPFLLNGIRLAKNLNLIPEKEDDKRKKIQEFLDYLQSLSQRIHFLQDITLVHVDDPITNFPVERNLVPGSVIEDVTQDVLAGEEGAHIAAFFDLDRTLIKGFSAKNFIRTRLLSGKMTTKEIIGQFSGVVVYALGNRNFASLASLGAQGVKDIEEKVFMEVGEEVYLKHLADSIYPESRALVAAHLSKGHTIAIVSAATPYQVDPIARDLGIDHVMCTRMEVENGRFTGRIIEPACWGKGKAIQAKLFAEERQVDLGKSYFYTDSFEDLALLEIVGNPRPINPDIRLSSYSFEHNWPIQRFKEDAPSQLSSIIRTSLAAGSMLPASLSGIFMGVVNMSWQDGVNSMMATFGDIGTAMAGIKLIVKGRENLTKYRPAVFLFNHQSGADIFIVSKLLRKDTRAIAKKELKYTPVLGQLMAAAGIIFIDRKNREKAIEAMKPAVDALKSGTSIAIAPEGTRSLDYTLGPFKKGAFHLAMQAQVPIVPIIIKNAHDALPKGSTLFKPTFVEVVIGEAIPTADWKRKNLNKHIESVRNVFLKTLEQEPINSI